MSVPAITMDVRRIGEPMAVVDIKGEVTARLRAGADVGLRGGGRRRDEQAGAQLRRPGVHEQRRHRHAGDACWSAPTGSASNWPPTA